MAPKNLAAWYTSAKAKPLEIKPAPYTSAKQHEIVIKTAAVALNPLDYRLQEYVFLPLEWPAILGGDVAGEVVEVGGDVVRFKVGDRVLAQATGLLHNIFSQSSFQHYVVVQDDLVAPIPNSLSFEAASTIPLALSTASSALFLPANLGLSLHNLESGSTTTSHSGEVILIWGGASSVGCNAIQLSFAAGYEVYTTASATNTDYLCSLGASKVFDYKSPQVVDQVVAALKNVNLVGILDCVNMNNAIQSCDQVRRLSNNTDKAIATVLPDIPEGMEDIKRIFGIALRGTDVAKVIYENFLPSALRKGSFKPAPEALVVGSGLESIQKGLDLGNKGVSAKKLVVSM